MGEANLYVVTFYQEDKRSGGCFPVTREEWAYSAQDARAQVELSFEGVSPRIRISGCSRSNQRGRR
jgi:hypothetical protein